MSADLSSATKSSPSDTESAPGAAGREFVITRTIDAPRELVFRAWIDPARLATWWGPEGFTNPVCEADARPGGVYRIVMRGPDGLEYPLTGVYREVREPERLVMTDAWDEHPAEWQELLNANLPRGGAGPSKEALNTVTFEGHGAKTLLTIRTLFDTRAMRDAMVKMGMTEGWNQSLRRLARHVDAEREVAVTRVLNAPRVLVFQAWTDPERLAHWWRPKGFAAPIVERLDATPGGGFRVVMTHSDGAEYTARGVYREVVEPQRLVYDDFCDEGGKLFHQALLTVTFDEHDGGTRVTIRARFEWLADRDPRWTPDVMKDGWREGWEDNLDLLEQHVALARAA